MFLISAPDYLFGTNNSLPGLWTADCLVRKIDISHCLKFNGNNLQLADSVTELTGKMYGVIRYTGSETVLDNITKAVKAIMNNRLISPEYVDDHPDIKKGMIDRNINVINRRWSSCFF